MTNLQKLLKGDATFFSQMDGVAECGAKAHFNPNPEQFIINVLYDNENKYVNFDIYIYPSFNEHGFNVRFTPSFERNYPDLSLKITSDVYNLLAM